ncbi:MAG: choice-of-anchor tandem repeat GloVer-containing protein [Candidatus Sulfotelmatobacter sp.]
MDILKITLGTFRSRKNFCGVILFCAVTAMASQAQTLTTLADFNGTNGAGPRGLIQGFDGNFYGTALNGGSQNWGTAFKMTPAGVLTTVHNFCSETNCLDGSWPEGRVTQASNGNFYGPADNGGTGGAGVIYSITGAGKFAVLYNFCVTYPCSDGVIPTSVVQARNGNLYGTTFGSHISYSLLGTVFELTLGGTLTTLHTFNGTDGAYPAGPMMQASNGNFYGTTQGGGSSTNCALPLFGGCGTVFQITPVGTLTTLHSFDGSDGSLPGYGGTLIEGADGSLYGTATNGGNSAFGGTIFKISPAGKFTTLYYFCSQTNCADGAGPVESLVQGTDGNIYGTTGAGGNSGGGTIFKITPGGVLTTLYDFCSQPNCADGAGSEAALVQATDGNFYGTTTYGGSDNNGTVFRFSMGLSPFVKLVANSGRVGQADGILGQSFTGTTGVFFNGTPANFKVVSDTIIRTTVPAGATTGPVTVDTPSGTLKSNVPFRVIP